MSFKCSIKTLNRLGDSFGDLVFINTPLILFSTPNSMQMLFLPASLLHSLNGMKASCRITQKCPEVAFGNCYFYSVELIEPAAIYLIYVKPKDSKLLNKSVFGA